MSLITGMSPFTVSLAAPSTRNEWGVTAFDTPVAYPAMIQFETRRTIGRDGRSVESTCQVYIDGDVTVDETYEVTMPFAPLTPPIVGVEKNAGARGIHHTVVLLGGR